MSALFGLLLFALPTPLVSSLDRGDKEFSSIHYPRAEAIYESVLTTSEDSASVLWRLARVYVCMADVAPQEQKLYLSRQAQAFAERSIVADPGRSDGHTWRAAALGQLAVFEGGKTKINLCHVIKQELDLAISINPKDDIAHSILGSFYMTLGNSSWIERQLAAIFLGGLPEGG